MNNLLHLLRLKKVTKMMLLKVICLSFHIKGKLRNTTKEVNRILPNKHKATLIYTFTKLASNFNIKVIINTEHKHDLMYSVKCPEETCNETYSGETGRTLVERTDEHRVKDKNSYVYQY